MTVVKTLALEFDPRSIVRLAPSAVSTYLRQPIGPTRGKAHEYRFASVPTPGRRADPLPGSLLCGHRVGGDSSGSCTLQLLCGGRAGTVPVGDRLLRLPRRQRSGRDLQLRLRDPLCRRRPVHPSRQPLGARAGLRSRGGRRLQPAAQPHRGVVRPRAASLVHRAAHGPTAAGDADRGSPGHHRPGDHAVAAGRRARPVAAAAEPVDGGRAGRHVSDAAISTAVRPAARPPAAGAAALLPAAGGSAGVPAERRSAAGLPAAAAATGAAPAGAAAGTAAAGADAPALRRAAHGSDSAPPQLSTPQQQPKPAEPSDAVPLSDEATTRFRAVPPKPTS